MTALAAVTLLLFGRPQRHATRSARTVRER